MYYNLLQKVRTEGAWEEWILFFLDAVVETAAQATKTITESARMFLADINAINSLGPRKAQTPLIVHNYMQKHIITTVKKASHDLSLTPMTVTKALINLSELKILKEVTGKSRGRIFSYQKYLTLLDKGANPI